MAEQLHQLLLVAASLQFVEERTELLVIESQRRPRWGGVRRGSIRSVQKLSGLAIIEVRSFHIPGQNRFRIVI